MTNKEIIRETFFRIRQNPGGAVLSALYMFALLSFIILTESLIYVSAKLLNIDYSFFSIDYYKGSFFRILFLSVRIFLYFCLCSAQMFIARRSYIDLEDRERHIEKYISGHIRRIMFPVIKRSLQLFLYKLLVLSPLSVGIYGIMYFWRGENMNEINLFGLVCFMLSVGFSIVWLGVCIHYFMSLSLVKYIVELNPRADFFDACDLSIKLMEGKHFRVFSFTVSMLPFLILSLLIYPLFITFPIYLESSLVFCREIMGEYWQDKLSAMSRRWEKQQERKRSE